jgi:DNA replication and repair protein RecF
MKVIKTEIKNFKNISYLSTCFCDGVNIIYGENAQGKTNIIEALWAFTGTRSFRGNHDSEQIKFGEKKADLKIDFFAQGRNQNAQIVYDDKKTVFLNGIKQPSISDFNGKYYAVIFSPEHLSLIKGGPAERRKFIDSALCQIKPSFGEFLSKYKKNLFQRNALLKDLRQNQQAEEMLDIFEKNLAHLGTKITLQRKKYLSMLEKETRAVYSGLSSQREKITLNYLQSFLCDEDEIKSENNFISALKKSRAEDIFTASTSVGPHRDDIEININGVSARKYGSQGQQRSCVLALKLGEANVLKNKTGEQPIALLDDVMSELDESRQDYILHHIDGWQVFITCCEPDTILKLKGGKTFKIQNGSLTEVNEK